MCVCVCVWGGGGSMFPCPQQNFPCVPRVSQGFGGTREHWQNIEGNKGTLANFWEQETKFRKSTVRKHSETVWEHGNIGQFWKGTREQGPPPPWEILCSRILFPKSISSILVFSVP